MPPASKTSKIMDVVFKIGKMSFLVLGIEKKCLFCKLFI